MGAIQMALTGFAVIGAWLSALLAWRSGNRATSQRELQGRREEWWRRFQWATELTMDPAGQRAKIGATLLTSLSRSELAGYGELDAILGVLAAVYGDSLAAEDELGDTGFERDEEEHHD